MRKIQRALSIRQPYAEQILRGTKKIEYRNRPTRIINERFYIYASLTLGDVAMIARLKKKVSDLRTGVLVGSVEVVNCRRGKDGYECLLANPERLAKPHKPTNHPQPAWFYPF